MNDKLKGLILEIAEASNSIPSDRKKVLDAISETIKTHLNTEEKLDIVVVCTHNSRRSQLGEVWINTLTEHFNLDAITAYSGGMEETAFNSRMVKAMRGLGFDISEVESGENPRYVVKEIDMDDHILFSKVYDHAMNPEKDFMALMVCGHADENCPIVHGMKYRIPLRYKDPKEFDDTAHESEAYKSKVKEIGSEIYYILDRVIQISLTV